MSAQAAEEQRLLNTYASVINSLSICGCVFNIIVTLTFNKSRTYFGKMVIALAIFDIFRHLFWAISILPATTSFFCQAGVWINYFGYASALSFTCSFAHSLYWSISQQSVAELERLFRKYVYTAILAGVIVGSIAVIVEYRKFNPDHQLCLSSSPAEGLYWKDIVVLIIPGAISILLCSLYYTQTMRLLRSLEGGHHLELLVYPLILIIGLMPTLIRKLGEDMQLWSQTWFPYRLMSYILMGSQGFLNALAYGMSRGVVDSIKEKCCPQKKQEVLIKSAPETETEDELDKQTEFRKWSIQKLRIRPFDAHEPNIN